LILSNVIAFFEALLFVDNVANCYARRRVEDVLCGLDGKYSSIVAYLGQIFDMPMARNQVRARGTAVADF